MIDKYQRRFPDDLVVLAVNLQEPATDVHIFANELDLKILVLLDSKAQVSTLYKIQGLPTTYFIDPIGKIRAIHIGSLSEQQMEDYLEKVGLQQ
jgi:peroxiredoxin